MEAVSEDGEVLSIAEAAANLPPPTYWRRLAGISEGELGPEYEEAFLECQRLVGPILETDTENAFNKSKYTSLPFLLAATMPVLNQHGLTLKQGCGRLIAYGGFDNLKRVIVLPIWTQVRHAKTGQWERVYIEMPLVKLDPQGFGSAMTYGRRYSLQAFFSIAGTDDDGVLASLKPKLEGVNVIEDAAAGMLEHISECKTVEELKGWQERNRQGFELLEEGVIQRLRDAYMARLQILKAEAANAPPPEPKVKKNVKTAGGGASSSSSGGRGGGDTGH